MSKIVNLILRAKLFTNNGIGCLHFYNPPRSDILVFDNQGSDVLRKTILYDMEYSILHARKERYYLTLTLAYLFTKNLKHLRLIYPSEPSPIKKIKRLLGQLIAQFYKIYLLSCIEYICPKVVITWVDNHPLFHWVSRIYDKAEFYAIQNGVRTENSVNKHRLLKAADPGNIISMPNFICFGDYEKDLYTAHRCKIDRFHPVGSLLAGWYKSQNIHNKCENTYDLCLVSQWYEGLEKVNPQGVVYLRRLHEFIAKYLKDHPISFCVATRCGDSDEMEYFKRHFGNNVNIIKYNKDTSSTYCAMDQSKVVITFESTAAREAFGWGKKVLFCNFSGSSIYDFPCEGFWRLNEYDYNKFEKHLNSIIAMSESEYSLAAKQSANYMMKNNANNFPHLYVRNILFKVLGRGNN